MAVFDPNAQNRRFGEIAQQANPQVSDPNQNRNLGGFPAGRRFSNMNQRMQKPAPATLPAPSPGVPPVPPGAAPSATGVSPSTQPVISPVDKRAALDAIPEEHRNGSLDGRYGGGGYEPIGEDEQWAGSGYSGADPRDAQLADKAAAETATPPPPGAAGGKGGQAMQQATDAGFTPPGGAGGGKGGGEAPTAVDTAPADPASPIVPAGDIGNTGTDPDDPIEYDDTGNYDDDTGFAPAFESKYNMVQGGRPGEILGHDKNPEAKARLQKIADRRLKEWTDAGGDPSNFMTFNPENGQYRNTVQGWNDMTPEQKWGARQTERGNFYDEQIKALRNAQKPGVK